MNQVIPAPPYIQTYIITKHPPPIRIKQLNTPSILQIVVISVVTKLLLLIILQLYLLFCLLLLRQVTMINQQSPPQSDQEMRKVIQIYFGYLKINNT